MTDQQAPDTRSLRSRLPGLMVRDRRRLQRDLDRASRAREPDRKQRAVAEVAKRIEQAEQRIERRRLTVPNLRYPADLPITGRRDDILQTIRDHQVVIVAGETGSGKSTQLPKLCLEAGRGVAGMVGHTQPRRIAARAVAERVAQELGTEVGDLVGYTVRFTDRIRDATLVRIMTDGILLAELHNDRLLTRYDTIIVDEVHERSLNIDFILGYIKQLLPRRRDLKVIITSATLDTEHLSRHFDDAPVIEVSGRAYPVEVRYRPLVAVTADGEAHDRASSQPESRDQPQGICDAVEELWTEGPGDILVFCSGEREIRDAADALTELDLPDTELLSLYARLSAAEQHRVFEPHHRRRVVLATNVAETSLTVPGIRYVVDPGTARISRYSRRTKVQRLPIEPVSQSSANQRAGRCGRVAPGICIRLYSEDDYASRPEFTDPEILRTSLASVILQMAAADLGDIESFPFVDQPDRRAVSDGIALLHELGALDAGQKLTPLGRRLARLPLDPRLGRMVLEAERNGCVREVMIIAAALSIQDPRERPADRQQAADQSHARFTDRTSDFISLLNLWTYLDDRRTQLSSSQFRKLCRSEFLNYLRVREWQDIFGQLRDVAQDLKIRIASPARDDTGAAVVDTTRVHMSLLSGLLSHIGFRDSTQHDYLGARGARFALSPGSALFKRSPRWVMAGELVETTRTWAHVAAVIQPEWAEPLAEHLVKRTYGEPQWDPNRGNVYTHERVMLYGLPIVASRRVDYARIDPAQSREIFIRRALVEGDWETHHAVLRQNMQLLDEMRGLEERARRGGIVVDDQTLYDFYDERLPADVVSARHFDAWWKKTRASTPHLLELTRDIVVNPAASVRTDDFPDTWREGDLELPLAYELDPGSDHDGVTVEVPLAVLNQAHQSGFEWHVPGYRGELVTALIRTLPRPIRRSFMSPAETARTVLGRIQPADGPLLRLLARELTAMSGVDIHSDMFELARLPRHLTITFRITDERGRTIEEGTNLDELRQRLQPDVRTAVAAATRRREQQGLRTWSFGTVPREVQEGAVKAYPALVDEGDSVSLRMFATRAEQRRAMPGGVRRLVLLAAAPSPRMLERMLTTETKLALAQHGTPLGHCLASAADQLIADHGGPVWDGDSFETLTGIIRPHLVELTIDVAHNASRILSAAGPLEDRLRHSRVPAPARDDMHSQLSRLVYPGFVVGAGARRLPDVVRYVQAIERRLDKLPENPARDDALMRQVHELERECDELLTGPSRVHVRWMIEELRVSLFAQQLGTAYRVSEKRIVEEIDRLRAQA